MKRYLILTIFLMSINAYSININKNAGVVLNDGLNMRAKPNVKSKAIIKLNKGDMFTVLSKTKKTFNDKTFKEDTEGYHWFKVKTTKGKRGWLFGKYIGISLTSQFYDDPDIKSNGFNFTKKDIDGDGKSETIWFIRKNEFVKFDYVTVVKIISIVITNSKGESMILDVAQYPTQDYSIVGLELKELTGDKNLEIILRDYMVGEGGESTQDDIKIISIINKKPVIIFSHPVIFEELGATNYNKVILEKRKIFIKTIDDVFVNHEIGYITENYEWNKGKQKFILTSQSDDSLPVYAKSSADNLRVRSDPDVKSKVITKLTKNQKVTVLKVGTDSQVTQTIAGKTGFWIKVKLMNGTSGWVFSPYLKFDNEFIQTFMRGDVETGRFSTNYHFIEYK